MERGWGDIDSLDVRLNVERMRIMRIRDRFVFASKRRERRSCRCRAVRFTPVDVGKARKLREILIYIFISLHFWLIYHQLRRTPQWRTNATR